MPHHIKSYQEKELEILRNAIDKAQQIKGKKIVESPEIKQISQQSHSLHKKTLQILFAFPCKVFIYYRRQF